MFQDPQGVPETSGSAKPYPTAALPDARGRVLICGAGSPGTCTFSSPHLFLHLCNHPFPAVNGSLSFAPGIPGGSPHNSVRLSGETCWRQSRRVFCSRLPPQMQRLSPPEHVPCHVEVRQQNQPEFPPLFTTSWIGDSFFFFFTEYIYLKTLKN